MEKIRVAIIGQGRSGRNIHGTYFLGEANKNFEVVAVVDAIEYRREKAIKEFGCKAFVEYQELFAMKDEIDVVVNASFSQMHYPITMDLLNHGFNVVVEKPFGATYEEAMDMVNTAQQKGVHLFVFQQSVLVETINFMKNVIDTKKIGDLVTMDVKYNNFAHRYDWQTLQCCTAGGLYNTAPHPIGISMHLLDCWDDAKLVYSDLRCVNTMGDSDDYARIIIERPDGVTSEIEVSSSDLTGPPHYKIQGTMGSLVMNVAGKYTLTYTLKEEQDLKPLQFTSLADENGDPIYCQEKVEKHVEEGELSADPFSSGSARFYAAVYETLVNGKAFVIDPANIANVVRIIHESHIANPMHKRYSLD